MKRIFYLFAMLLLFILPTAAQDTVRTVISKSSDKFGHNLKGIKIVNKDTSVIAVGNLRSYHDPQTIYYMDNEKTPFTGKYLKQYANGTTYQEMNFQSGLLHGPFYDFEYDSKGDSMYIKMEENYKNGKLCGNYVERMSAQYKKKEWSYDENGKKHGKAVFFIDYSYDTLATDYYNHGAKIGTWTSYYRGGQISDIENFKDGLNHGEYLRYFKNGNIMEKSTYVNDYKEGNDSIWYESGILHIVTGFLHGKKHGKEYLYDENGLLDEERTFEHGKKKGRFVWYNSDGTVYEETIYY